MDELQESEIEELEKKKRRLVAIWDGYGFSKLAVVTGVSNLACPGLAQRICEVDNQIQRLKAGLVPKS